MRRIAWLVPFLAACGGGGDDACEIDETYAPAIDPARFTGPIDNPLWPLTPGTTFVFGGDEDVTVEVTSETRTILGIEAVVVRDTVREGGEVIEDTFDWYAQDDDGNVWYLGEDTKEYEGGQVVSTAGSWEAGVDGAQPGIVMHAQPPAAGEPYRQEYYPCEAEDEAEVAETGVAVSVTFGDFTDCIKTREFTRLDPEVNEHKYYCAGIGLVLEETVAGDSRVELVSVTPAPASFTNTAAAGSACPDAIPIADAIAIAESAGGGTAVAIEPDDDVACAREMQVLRADAVLWEIKVAGDGTVLESELSDENED
jgi:hypothetical protein